MTKSLQDYNPTTLEEAVDAIYDMMTPEDRKWVNENGTDGMHHGFMMNVRNAWGLWKEESVLANHFRTRFGLGMADDMSGLIASQLESRIKGVPGSIEQEVQKYKDHWAKQDVDPLTMDRVKK